MSSSQASRTAVLVCQGRAVAHGRIAVGRFDDPTALALLREDERAPVEQARTGLPPNGWGPRIEYEMLSGGAGLMAARTIAIDDAIRERENPQVVILGAGLDGRAWRMPELGDVDVYEVDHPATQQDKRDRVAAGEIQPVTRSLRFVPVDLAHDALDTALAEAGHQASRPTTWVWEGVLTYLTRDEVEATVRVLAGLSAPGSRLILTYQISSLASAVGRRALRWFLRLGGRPDPLAREPWRSLWDPRSMRELLDAHALRVVRDERILTIAGRLAIPIKRRGASAGRVAVADR